MLLRSFTAACAAILLSGPVDARAQALVSTGESFVTARLLPGIPLEEGGRLAGLRLEMKPGWKTYWRHPGEAGIPPQFDTTASANLAAFDVLWPRPGIFQSFGMETIGYADQVVLPIRLIPVDPSEAMTAAMTIHLGVCREICVLEEIKLSERIELDTPAIGQRQIRRAFEQIPPPGAQVGLTRATCQVSGTGEERALEVALAFDRDLEAPVVLFDSNEHAHIRPSGTSSAPGFVYASAEVYMASADGWFDRSSLRMTVLAKDFAADVVGCEAPAG